MSKYNKTKIMQHAWNIVRSAKNKNKVVYIATAMRKAWSVAKEKLQQEIAQNEMVKLSGFTEILEEREKAIFVKTSFEVWNGFDTVSKNANIWLPKSQIKITKKVSENFAIISVKAWVLAEKHEEFTAYFNAKKFA